RSRVAIVRGGARERSAAQRRASEHGGLFLGPETGRQRCGDESRARWTSLPWASGEFLREILHRLAIRRERENGTDRLRRVAKTSGRSSAGDDHGRRVSLSADYRFP